MNDIEHLIVIDLETTGLNESIDVPLEIGVAVADSNLEILSSFKKVVLAPEWKLRLEYTKYNVPHVWQMHLESGLIEELLAAEAEGTTEYQPEWVDQAVYNWLIHDNNSPVGHAFPGGLTVNKYPATGSSVHFDRRFTRSFFPLVDSFFTYRIADVSSVKEFCKFFNPKLYAKLPEKNKSQHRVLNDVENTLDELRWYRDNFFWVEDDE